MAKSVSLSASLLIALAIVACEKKIDPVEPPVTADLSVRHVTATGGPLHSLDHVVLHFSVKNVGPDDAPATSITARFSLDSAITPADAKMGSTFSIPALDASDTSATIAVSVQLPDSVAAGNYFVGLIVERSASVIDADTTNDGASASVAVVTSFLTLANRLSVAAAPGYCATSATKAVYCWGLNQRWQFGSATPVSGSNVPYLTAVPAMDVLARGPGNDHMCGLVGTAATCWGRAEAGMLGNGVLAPGTFSEPVSVSGGIIWSAITVSQLSACGISTTGLGYCWGSNQRGEVGSTGVGVGGTTSTGTVATTPHLLDGGLKFRSVIAGWLHACGISTTGAAYCWGDNTSGQLGFGVVDTAGATARRVPAAVAGGLKFVQLALGSRHTCGITTTHEAYCWGTNGAGQLGDGTTIDRSVPTAVLTGQHFSLIAAGPGFGDGLSGTLPLQGGTAHTCALTETGVPYCWGFNLWGQLGDGSNTQRNSPVLVSGGLTFTTIATGGSSTCGMIANQIRCWGANGSGQLGVGGGGDANVPVILPAPFATP